MVDHSFVVVPHGIKDILASFLRRAGKRIVRDGDDEQVGLRGDFKLFGEGCQRRIVLSHFIGHSKGIKGYYVAVSKSEAKGQTERDVVDVEGGVEQHLIILRVVLVISRSYNERDFANYILRHFQEFNIVSTVVAV